jgi:hypothetical protein
MKKYILALFAVMSSMTVFGQEIATTEEGKKVSLHPDGTWEYIVSANEDAVETTTTEEPQAEVHRPTSSVFLGGKRLLAGNKTIINSEDNSLITSVTLAKDGNQTLIMFWQESDDDRMSFFHWNWTGTVYLFLENGETISLTDRNMHGQNKIPNGKLGNYQTKYDVYQRFSGHYLTLSECQKLKRSNLIQVAYRTTEEEPTIRLQVTENQNTLREQLLDIGR